MSFAVAAAIAGEFDPIDAVVTAGLAAPELAALHSLLERMAGINTELRSDREGTAIAVNALRQELTARPAEFLWSGVWLLLHVRASKLQDGVAGPLVDWLFYGWRQLVRDMRFRLRLPAVTIPPIETILSEPDRSLSAAARLLLAAAPAASTTLVQTARTHLEELAATDA